MFFRRKKKSNEVEVKAFFHGTVLPLEKVNDETIASKMLGDGIAIEPEDGTLYAPITGTITSIFDTKHAIGFEAENGTELLLHIGIDTVELEGKGFELDVSVGDKVEVGSLMGKVDLDFVRAQGKEAVSPILVTNPDDKIQFVKTEGSVNVGEVLYKISK